MTRDILIGLSLDHENDQKYSHAPYYALRDNYIDSLKSNNASPILLPFDNDSIENYLDIIDGIIVTGGNFDVSPSHYGDDVMHPETSLKTHRTDFEIAISKIAIKRNIPYLGICGGMQLLNIILGGDMIQHIPDSIENPLKHEVKPYDQGAHEITITAKCLLSKIYDNKSNTANVNSSHHQAAGKQGKDCIISATSSDGVIEAIEYQKHPFCLGVQWHPEYQICQLDKNIFQSFCEAAREYKNNKS
jgi:putative glutamine amidotransferase